jgi:hypothetical protein
VSDGPELKALGIDLVGPESSIGTPVDVFVITRVMDEDVPHPTYRILCNEECDTVLAMGMLTYALMMIKHTMCWSPGEEAEDA